MSHCKSSDTLKVDDSSPRLTVTQANGQVKVQGRPALYAAASCMAVRSPCPRPSFDAQDEPLNRAAEVGNYRISTLELELELALNRHSSIVAQRSIGQTVSYDARL